MVFALVVERASPRPAILQLSERNNFQYALRKLDCMAMLHEKWSRGV
jgi:hypothetical protein